MTEQTDKFKVLNDRSCIAEWPYDFCERFIKLLKKQWIFSKKEFERIKIKKDEDW